MAIYHCTVKALSRSTGRSAPGAAAYRAGDVLTDNRTGEVFDYTRKGGVLSADIVLPEGAPDWARDRNQLWNAAEAAERRKDACVAREYEVALPYELTHDQRRELALAFARELVERHGVAADVCLHEPSKDGNEKNFHAHILTTTRVMGPEGLEGKAEIEKAGRNRTRDLKETRALWAQLCNEALERAGHSVRVDHRSYAEQGIDLTPTKHIGVSAVAMDRKGLDAERAEIHAETRAENAARIEENPTLILDKITRTQAVFDRHDIARELHRYIDDPQQFQNLMVRLDASAELVQLAPERHEGGRTIPARLTTREMIETERAMIGSAETLAASTSHGIKADRLQRILARYDSLSDEQRAAVEVATSERGLSVIVGDAGTGKSFSMRVAKEIWEAEGYRVRGCALAGKAADELQAGSGIESRTIHSLEASWSRGRDMLTARDVLVIDEAGMVGSRQLGRVLAAAEKAGAKVVMLGDYKQIEAIEAGAGFRAITERVGAVEITQIRRQREDWARDASAEFARGDVRAGLDAYNQRGRVRMLDDREAAKAALAADWLADREKGGSSIILAHTNADVRSLNDTIRSARQEAGELGQSAEFVTERGRREFAEGDRLVFLKNNGALGVKNGTLGTVERAFNGHLAVRLDDGRQVAFNTDQYGYIDHGYAVTFHKAQGVTVDRAFVLATGGMDRNLAYVGMTRHREAATLYAGRNDFGSYDKLARGLARQRPKESTLDFAESAYGFADRRDFDGAGVVGRWIERTREKLTELGERAEKAVATVLERVGVRPAERQVERPRGFVPTDRHRDLSELIGGAEPAPMTPEEAARAAARAEVERAFGGAQERETPKPTADDPQTRLMNKLRGDVAAAEKAGDELARIVAEGKLQKAEELAGRGEPLTHRLGEIEKAGQDALKQWAQGQQRPALDPERAAARAEVERAMGHGRKRDRGIEFD